MSMRQLKISKSITSRESESIGKYLHEINKVELISAEEEAILSRQIRDGNQAALNRLVKANLRFVISVAKQFQGQGLSLPDLINEGNLGLIKAAKKFDESRGFKFISFAVWWIRQSIYLAIADNARMVRVPLNKLTLRMKIDRTAATLEQKLGRTASADEVAESLNMDPDEINSTLGQGNRHLSLDAPFSEDEESSSLLDQVENQNTERTEGDLYHGESLKLELNRSLKVLTDRQQQTLCYFFGIGMDHSLSLEDIAQKFDLTRERVRQIKDKAIDKLRTTSNFDVLRSYLGA
jgi:RNA polymerase primary sigma factor